MSDFAQTLSLAKDAGAYGLLVLAVIGGYRGWYVWRWQYDRVERERDDWKRIALRGLNIAEQVVPK